VVSFLAVTAIVERYILLFTPCASLKFSVVGAILSALHYNSFPYR